MSKKRHFTLDVETPEGIIQLKINYNAAKEVEDAIRQCEMAARYWSNGAGDPEDG